MGFRFMGILSLGHKKVAHISGTGCKTRSGPNRPAAAIGGAIFCDFGFFGHLAHGFGVFAIETR